MGVVLLVQTLTTLILRENRISELPAAIGKLTQLAALDISHNNLQSLPQGEEGVGLVGAGEGSIGLGGVVF